MSLAFTFFNLCKTRHFIKECVINHNALCDWLIVHKYLDCNIFKSIHKNTHFTKSIIQGQQIKAAKQEQHI